MSPNPKQSQLIIIVAVASIIVVIGILATVLILGNEARVNALKRQSAESTAPLMAIKRQIKKITLEHQTANGDEIDVISADGTISRYINGHLVKTGQQGFATTQSLFHDAETALNNGTFSAPSGYHITIDTNQGEIQIEPGPSPSPGSTGGQTIIDEINNTIDQTLNPTPKPSSQPTSLPESTPIDDTDDQSISPTPSSLPGYLTAPPFNCSDYYKSGKALKISNVHCGPTPAP